MHTALLVWCCWEYGKLTEISVTATEWKRRKNARWMEVGTRVDGPDIHVLGPDPEGGTAHQTDLP